jgi:vesicular inhibitory amino acid transporter
MFLEVQSEMIDGRRFPTACRVAYSFITMVYTLTTTVAYGMQGDAVAPFLPDSLTDGALKRVVGACLAFHILVAYVVTAQPLTAFLYSKAFRATPLHPTTPAVRLRWLLVTSGYLAWSVLCSNAVPFFGDLQELIGGFNGAPIIFGWPALFYLGAARQRGRGALLRGRRAEAVRAGRGPA